MLSLRDSCGPLCITYIRRLIPVLPQLTFFIELTLYQEPAYPPIMSFSPTASTLPNRRPFVDRTANYDQQEKMYRLHIRCSEQILTLDMT